MDRNARAPGGFRQAREDYATELFEYRAIDFCDAVSRIVDALGCTGSSSGTTAKS